MTSFYMVWRLECGYCGKQCSPLCWDYEAPDKCTCGGPLYRQGTNETMSEAKKSTHNVYASRDRDQIEKELNDV